MNGNHRIKNDKYPWKEHVEINVTNTQDAGCKGLQEAALWAELLEHQEEESMGSDSVGRERKGVETASSTSITSISFLENQVLVKDYRSARAILDMSWEPSNSPYIAVHPLRELDLDQATTAVCCLCQALLTESPAVRGRWGVESPG